MVDGIFASKAMK